MENENEDVNVNVNVIDNVNRNEVLTKAITDTLNNSIADKMKLKPSDKEIKELDYLV